MAASQRLTHEDKEGLPAKRGALVQGPVLKKETLQSGKIETQETGVRFLKLSREEGKPALPEDCRVRP